MQYSRSRVPLRIGECVAHDGRFFFAEACDQTGLVCARESIQNRDDIQRFFALPEYNLRVTGATQTVGVDGGNRGSSICSGGSDPFDRIIDVEGSGLDGVQQVFEFLRIHGSRLTHKAMAAID